MTGSTGGTGELIYAEGGCGVVGINDGAGTAAYAGSWKAACWYSWLCWAELTLLDIWVVVVCLGWRISTSRVHSGRTLAPYQAWLPSAGYCEL
jgi:hypothetical protein